MKLRLRYSLRTFLGVLTLVTIFGGCELNRQSRQADVVRALRANPMNRVQYDFELVESSGWTDKKGGLRATVGELVRQRFHSDFFCSVWRVYVELDPSKPEDLARLESLPHLRWLQIADSREVRGGEVSPDLFAVISKCHQLEFLALGGWLSTSDFDLRLGLTRSGIGGITLSPLNLTARHLAGLYQLKRLRILVIGGPGITDEAIEAIAPLGQLEHLYLSHVGVSAAGMLRLQALLPQTTIVPMDDKHRDYMAEIRSKF